MLRKNEIKFKIHTENLLNIYIGDQEISPLHPQTNATEPDNPRTWSAASVVQIPVTRERHGEIIKCLAIHESYAAKSVVVEAKMDVKCEFDILNCISYNL